MIHPCEFREYIDYFGLQLEDPITHHKLTMYEKINHDNIQMDWGLAASIIQKGFPFYVSAIFLDWNKHDMCAFLTRENNGETELGFTLGKKRL